MREYPSAVAAHLAARKGLLVHALIWLVAKDRGTGAPEPLGLWTGADHEDIEFGGVTRRYYGVGGVLGLDPFISQAQGHEQTWAFRVSSLHEQVIEAIRIYDARLARIEVHSWYFDPLTQNPLADPVRELRGTVMEIDLPTPPEGGEAIATVTCVPDAWRLTRPLTLKRSASALLSRASGDGLRRHNGSRAQVAWGEWVKEVGPEAKSSPSDIKVHMGGER